MERNGFGMDDPYSALGTPHAMVWNGLEQRYYEVAQEDLALNPLREVTS